MKLLKKKPSSHNTRDCALNLLARREHSRHELVRKLRSREFDEREIETVLTSLAEAGLQSDTRFVEAYIHQRLQNGFGPLRICLELKQRGIAEEQIEPLLPTYEEIRERIHQVWQKKYRGQRPVNATEYAKQQRFLLQRGFSAEFVCEELKESTRI